MIMSRVVEESDTFNVSAGLEFVSYFVFGHIIGKIFNKNSRAIYRGLICISFSRIYLEFILKLKILLLFGFSPLDMVTLMYLAPMYVLLSSKAKK
jgi:hypothetical protein